MSASKSTESTTVEVNVTFRVAVGFPDAKPDDVSTAAQEIAVRAAEHLAHVSSSRILAFNEVNRVHPQAPGVIESVATEVRAA